MVSTDDAFCPSTAFPRDKTAIVVLDIGLNDDIKLL